MNLQANIVQLEQRIRTMCDAGWQGTPPDFNTFVSGDPSGASDELKAARKELQEARQKNKVLEEQIKKIQGDLTRATLDVNCLRREVSKHDLECDVIRKQMKKIQQEND